jgi:REP-associated tyrosine transposase
VQLEFTAHGGRRPGAGRRRGDRVSHDARPSFDRITAAHVTLRVNEAVPSLRSSRRFRAIRTCFAASRGRFGLRLVHFSVLSNHLHLIVEADNSDSLARGMQGLCIRLAKALNGVLGRAGRLFTDHYHSHLLRTPTEVLSSIKYVQNNAERHYGEPGPDWCSSAAPDAKEILAEANGWLLSIGWKRSPRAAD